MLCVDIRVVLVVSSLLRVVCCLLCGVLLSQFTVGACVPLLIVVVFGVRVVACSSLCDVCCV